MEIKFAVFVVALALGWGAGILIRAK